MNWKIKATLQKILSFSATGDKLNHLLVTFNKDYHKNVTAYQTYETIRKFSYCDFDTLNDKKALEIGTGYSLISSVVLSLLGFSKIVTVDITKDINIRSFKKQFSFINDAKLLEMIRQKSSYTKQQIDNKIKLIAQKKNLEDICSLLNITYIAPYSFEEIENVSKDYDYIFSQVVLEHVQPHILNIIFQKIKILLTTGGCSVHTINFIDHFANPGLFQDKSISEFNFLKFSDKYWHFWAGNSIAYTNRLSYIYYLQLCKENSLNNVEFIGENYRDRKTLNKELIHKDVINKYKKIDDLENLTKYQRGTLIIKNR
jgi:hypothetical protein